MVIVILLLPVFLAPSYWEGARKKTVLVLVKDSFSAYSVNIFSIDSSVLGAQAHSAHAHVCVTQTGLLWVCKCSG